MLPPLIIQISLVVLMAFIGGAVAHKLNIPLVVGYLLVGLGFGSVYSRQVQSTAFIDFFSEIGIALLLFTLGLEFSLDRLKSVGRPAIFGAVLQIVLTSFFGFFLFPVILGATYAQSLFLGAAISLSSTAVVVKLLYERGEMDSVFGELEIGWLIIQDLAVFPLMMLLPLLSLSGGVEKLSVLNDIILPFVKVIAILYITVFFGRKAIPSLFRSFALFANRELLLLASFAFALLFASFSHELGLSFALGAFLAGIILSTAVVNHEIFSEIRPIRDLFASLFFVSIGFWVSLDFIFSNIVNVLLVFVSIIAFKFLAVFFISLYLKYHPKIAFFTALGLFQVGEFSFVLVKMGKSIGILDGRLFDTLVAATILSLVVSPFAFAKSKTLYRKTFDLIKKRMPSFYKKFVEPRNKKVSMYTRRGAEYKDHVIVVGYGRVGKHVVRIFDLANIPYVVVDYNLKNLEQLRRRNKPYIYGDAVDEDILLMAGIRECKAIALAIPDIMDNELILKHCLRLNCSAKLVARAHKDIDAARLKIRGVSHVIEPEFEASISIAKYVLYTLDLSIGDTETLLAKARKEYRF